MRLSELLLEKWEKVVGLTYRYGEEQDTTALIADEPVRTAIESGQFSILSSKKIAATSWTPHLVIDMIADTEREIECSDSFVECVTPKKGKKSREINTRHLELSPDEFFFLF